MNMYVDSFDDDELEIVLDESEGLEVLLNSGAITWSEIAGDITKNKAVVDFLNSLPMLPDIPVEEVEHILKANAGEATWQVDNKATQEELLNGLNEVNQLITDGLATKQDVGDYALRSELEEASQTLQESINTKQDAGDYATNTQLSDGLAEKQDKGDYITKTLYDQTNENFNNALATKQDVGDYALKSELNEASQALQESINTKQDAGNYALVENIPDLTDYVKNTDYATADKGGVVMVTGNHGLAVYQGMLLGSAKTLDSYNASANNLVTTKGTLENIKDDYVKRGVTENSIELTVDEKASVKQWLGYAEPIDIISAIASIPQFKLTIVSELPTKGEKMTLYFVPKTGTDTDVHDEYIWIEENNKYEYVGTTAVDLTDYVKNTDYAQGGVAGVVKTSAYYGASTNTQGFLLAAQKSLSDYGKGDSAMFVAKGTLENVLTQYAKTLLITEDDYNALETKDANTLYLIEE